MEPQVFIDKPLDQLISTVKSYKERGWRLANLCGSTVEDEVELLYSFSQGIELENIRIMISNECEVPAISSLYPEAFVFENETHDLYGVRFKGVTLDYNGVFYPTSVPSPMNPGSVMAEQYLAREEESRG